jgi:N-carbamoyl-L-amino-acid hydrolase
VGSHLDTQPTGGKYDGVLGVLGGLEIIRTLNDLGIKTKHPIVVTNWTNEEGTRFAPAMLPRASSPACMTRTGPMTARTPRV